MVLVRGATGALPDVTQAPPVSTSGRRHEIPAVYDGPDLDLVAQASGLSRDDVIRVHAEREYTVDLIGFLPGFAYMQEVDPRLVMPRRPSPRPLVARGSIGIAGTMTGIYPFASPGGWNLLGRAPATRVCDPQRTPATLFAPGDVVRFVPRDDVEDVVEHTPTPPTVTRGLRILSIQAGATIQDGGRRGLLGQGIAPSGALDGEALALANGVVGNPAGAAAVEIPLGGAELGAVGDLLLATDDGDVHHLRDGDRVAIAPSSRAVRYVAVAGGVEVPVVLGSRSTLLVARLGGFLGRGLRKGDVIPVGNSTGTPVSVEPLRSGDVEVSPGPHLDRFPAGAWGALLRGTWRISPLMDRVGVRLEGSRIPREGPDLALPCPMIRGAIQVTTDGTPIILGPDHPATGGYPVLAVVRAGSLGALARLRPGASVRFRP
ncbi:MAG: carboxyltransferase domain-containing protein [Myxococcota bacterium]